MLQDENEGIKCPYCLLFYLYLHYFISVPVLEVNGLVLPSHAPGLAVLKEAPTFQHLMRNIIPSSETVAMFSPR